MNACEPHPTVFTTCTVDIHRVVSTVTAVVSSLKVCVNHIQNSVHYVVAELITGVLPSNSPSLYTSATTPICPNLYCVVC